MNIMELIKTRRSIRKYTDEKVAKEDLEEIVEAGLWAPSGQNRQPWYYVVVHSEEEMEVLRGYFQGIIEPLTDELNESFARHPEVIKETLDFTRKLGNANAVVLAFLQKDYADIVETMYESVAAGIQNMLLVAHSKGISSCWQTSPLYIEEQLRNHFAPGKGKLVACITFGYTDMEVREIPRKDGRVTFL